MKLAVLLIILFAVLTFVLVFGVFRKARKSKPSILTPEEQEIENLCQLIVRTVEAGEWVHVVDVWHHGTGPNRLTLYDGSSYDRWQLEGATSTFNSDQMGRIRNACIEKDRQETIQRELQKIREAREKLDPNGTLSEEIEQELLNREIEHAKKNLKQWTKQLPS